MKKHLSLAIGALLVVGGLSQAQAQNCRIAGVWKSNEKLTLKNMESARLTDKQRQVLSNNLFGKLIHNYTCQTLTTTFEGQVETFPLQSMKEWGDTVTVVYHDPSRRANVKSILTFTGNCFSVPVGRLGFEEVFCRVK